MGRVCSHLPLGRWRKFVEQQWQRQPRSDANTDEGASAKPHTTADVTHTTAYVTHTMADVTHTTADVTHTMAGVTHAGAYTAHATTLRRRLRR
jgi:hypothetical protein